MLQHGTALLFLSTLAAQQFAPPAGRTADLVMPEGRFNVVAFGDADGDGRLDLCTNDSYANVFSFVRRTGNHTWTTTGLLPGVVTAAAWADLDGDGDMDLVVGGSGPSHAPIGVLRNDGAGFTWTFEVAGMMSGTVTAFAIGDVDGDGDLDVVAGLTTGTQVLSNNGSGTLTTPGPVLSLRRDARPVLFDRDGDADLDLAIASPTGLQLFDNAGSVFTDITASLPLTVATAVAAADFDRDGRIDLALAHGTILDLLWNGAAGWTPATGLLNAGEPVQALATADLDRDGFADLVVQLGTAVDWLQNGHNRTFARQPGLRHGSPAATVAIATGDLTGRGGTDLLCLWSDGTPEVLHANAPLPFTDPMALPALATRLRSAGCIPAVGDVDGDGRPDLVLPNTPQVLHNEGGGVLRSMPITGARTSYQQAWLADLDGDGDLDLLLSLSTTPTPPVEPLQRFTNDGTGRFTPVQDIPLAGFYGDFACADIDGDGDVDILAPVGAGQVQWFQNVGPAGFVNSGAIPTINGQSFGNRLIVADLDGDRRLDVITGHVASGLPIHLGNGLGVFTTGSVVPLPPGQFAIDIVAGDVDGDGDLDLVVNQSNRLVLFRNNGTGTFTRDPAMPFLSVSRTLRLLDVDDDGDLDLWAHDYLLLNDGQGLFTVATNRLWSPSFGPSVFVDVDEDGDPDLMYIDNDTWRTAPNRLRNASSLQVPRPGGALQVRFEHAPYAPVASAFALPCFAFASGPPVAIAGLSGNFRLPAAGTTVIGLFAMTAGAATWTVAVPNNAAFLGLDLFTQAIVGAANVRAGCTNLVHERILP